VRPPAELKKKKKKKKKTTTTTTMTTMTTMATSTGELVVAEQKKKTTLLGSQEDQLAPLHLLLALLSDQQKSQPNRSQAWMRQQKRWVLFQVRLLWQIQESTSSIQTDVTTSSERTQRSR
jgi:hypothetical protein